MKILLLGFVMGIVALVLQKVYLIPFLSSWAIIILLVVSGMIFQNGIAAEYEKNDKL